MDGSIKSLERPTEIVVMTFNILRSNRGHRSTIDCIAAERPDVLALQELSLSAADDIGRGLHELLPHQSLDPRSGVSGGGVLSRFPIVAEQRFVLEPGGHACQHLQLDCSGRSIGMINIHLSAPKFSLRRYDPSRRDREARVLAGRMEQVPDPLIVAGDFNMTPRSLGYLLLTARLRDAYREAGIGSGRTFPHAPRVGRIPMPLWPAPFPVIRIDYIFHSSDLQARRTRVGQGDGSDHLPVIAELGFTF